MVTLNYVMYVLSSLIGIHNTDRQARDASGGLVIRVGEEYDRAYNGYGDSDLLLQCLDLSTR